MIDYSNNARAQMDFGGKTTLAITEDLRIKGFALYEDDHNRCLYYKGNLLAIYGWGATDEQIRADAQTHLDNRVRQCP
jgi:hypothetical protein